MEFYRRKFFQVKIENPGHFAYHNQDEKSSLHRQGAQTRTWRVTVISTFAVDSNKDLSCGAKSNSDNPEQF